MVDKDFVTQLRGWSLTYLEIEYYIPGTNLICPNSFGYQQYDQAPRFPRMVKLLDFWVHGLKVRLYQVKLMHSSISGPAEVRYVGSQWKIN